ncbi:S9 family peptidase [Legionella drancourtii]|nr:prolyl oligopeptidase family serine peptidase [Legionella drancourtii]
MMYQSVSLTHYFVLHKSIKNTIKSLAIFIVSSTLAVSTLSAETPLLTRPLPAKSGTTVISKDWLLNESMKHENNFLSINWLNNKTLIYSISSSINGQEDRIATYNLLDKTKHILGEGSIPKPSPDGQWIAFIKGKGEAKQLWIMRADHTEEKQLSFVDVGLGHYQFTFDFVWAPDSKKLILEHQPYVPHWEKKPKPKSMIDSIDITTGQSRQLASFDASIFYLSWLPASNEVLFVKQRVGAEYNEEIDRDWVQALNTQDASVRTLIEFDGLQQFLKPIASPDGQKIALLYDAENPIFTFMLSLGLIPANANTDKLPVEPIQLTHELQLGTFEWSRNGKNLYAKRYYGAYSQLYKIDANSGEALQITNAPMNIETSILSPDGNQIAWTSQDAHGVYRLQVASSTGINIKNIEVINTAPEEMTLSEVREIDWKTTDYPVNMRGLVVMPLNYQKGKQYPLIVDIHGGDTGASIYLLGGTLLSSPLEWQLWAAKGYAVFIPEFRSSASFGSLAITRDFIQEHDRLGGDLKDIEAGVDSLIARGIVDIERMVVIGHSAGGLRSNWLTVSTHRYKAVVSKEGWADEWTWALNEPPSKRHYVMYGGTPWDVPENYLKNSALYHAAGADTPTLFLMANPEKGGADKYQTVFQLYYALKNNGVDTLYKYYSDEGHVFEKLENRKDSLEQIEQWIDSHITKK